MSHRTFVDAQGQEWQVWNVAPHALDADRRMIPERRTSSAQRDPERRTIAERRRAEDRRTRRRLIGDGLESGWLTFATTHEKRRLAPVPDGWDGLDDRELEVLCTRPGRTSTLERKPVAEK